MVAYRVIDDHNELENIGSRSHDQLDLHITDTPFLVASGSVADAPSSRYLAAGAGIEINDGGPGNSLTITATASPDYTFPDDLTVSLTSGRTFGRYASGEVIPATGKTPAEVILMAIAEPIDPTVSLDGTNVLTTAFNTVGSVTTSLNGNYTINSAGASVQSATLEHRVGGAGPWVILSTSITNPLSYEHTFDVAPFYTTTLNYRYTIVDSQGATTTAIKNITPQPYAPPIMNLSIVRNDDGGIVGESDLKREKGNISSTLSGAITRQRINVPITSYSVQFSVDNSTWFDVPGLSSIPVSGNPPSVTIPSTVHNDVSLKGYNVLYYRVRVNDIYTTSNSSVTTINFLNVVFYGPSENIPVNSGDVRGLGNKVFTDSSNPFNLETGSTYKNFVVAIPSTLSISEVLDLDALNANITNSYVLVSLNVNNGGDVPTSYSVYTMSNAIAYSSNHRHKVTRS